MAVDASPTRVFHKVFLVVFLPDGSNYTFWEIFNNLKKNKVPSYL